MTSEFSAAVPHCETTWDKHTVLVESIKGAACWGGRTTAPSSIHFQHRDDKNTAPLNYAGNYFCRNLLKGAMGPIGACLSGFYKLRATTWGLVLRRKENVKLCNPAREHIYSTWTEAGRASQRAAQRCHILPGSLCISAEHTPRLNCASCIASVWEPLQSINDLFFFYSF